MTHIKHFRRSLATAALAMVSLGAAHAATFDESVLGDISNDRLNPTTWKLPSGTDATTRSAGGSFDNFLIGTLGRSGNTEPDRDYLHIVVPEGMRLSAMILGAKSTMGVDRSFVGLAAGSTMPVPSDALDANGLLGFWLYGKEDRGTDLLASMSPGYFGASGFETPLKSGDYTLWVQELAVGSYKYEFNLVLTPVPEPTSVLMWAAGLGGLGWVAARRRRGEG